MRKDLPLLPLHHLFGACQVPYKQFCLTYPGGFGILPHGGFRSGVATPARPFLFAKNATPHAHRNSHTHRTGHPLRQTRLGASSPTLKPTAGIETNGVHSGKYFALCTYSVHLPQVRQNEPFRLRPPFPGAFGLLLSGDKIGGEKHGHSLRACRKRAGRLRGLIC